MNFSAKFALALVVGTTTGTLVYPTIASAGPTTGSTAAAVSIKFQDCKCGPTSGNFSIDPGGNTKGGGNGVQELSAAVATGETKAKASSESNKFGTSAYAEGYSKPVTFKYETSRDVIKKEYSSEYAYSSEYKKEAAIEFAANQKDSKYRSETDTKKGDTEEYKKYSSSSVKLEASYDASAKKDGNGSKNSESSVDKSRTTYEYKGSSAGLSAIPILK
jgi:hypothetical protein